jgi:gliding motility-associated-like protein
MRKALLISLIIITGSLFAQFSVGFTADTTLGCDSIRVSFNDTSIVNNFQDRLWEFGDGQTDTAQSPIHNYDTVGVYTVTLTVHNTITGNSVSKVITVRKNPNALIQVGRYPTYTVNDTIYFSDKKILHKSVSIIDSLDYTYNWIIDLDTLLDTTSHITHNYENSGIYICNLEVIAFAGCSDTVSSIFVINEKVSISNIFTPNGDGQNDLFIIKSDGKTVNELTIFSRYGTVVYNQKSTKNWWDGRNSAGDEVRQGTYYYVLKPDNGEVIKGTIYLSR